MTICKEMSKLRQYLDNKGIKWKDTSAYDNLWICRTHFELNGYRWSVINGFGTYGGWGALELEGDNKCLLELMTNSVNNGEPIGYLTADDVIDYIEKLRKEQGNDKNI